MRTFVICLLTLFLSAGVAQAGGTFRVIVDNSPSTTVFDFSADGTWATGTDNGQVYRWSADTGIELLSPSEWLWTHTAGISDDGTKITSSVQYGDTDPRVFGPAVWTEGIGWSEIDNLYPDPPYDGGGDLSFGSGYDISGDGSTVCGLAWHLDYRASGFTWTEAGGIVNLGQPPNGNSSRASEISGDGSVVVGFYEADWGGRRPVRWIDNGPADLFLGEATWGEANGVSEDGNYITGDVGFDDDPGYGWSIGFLYSDDEGYIDLGLLPEHEWNPWDNRSSGVAVSDTGVVVGWGGATGPWGEVVPAVWTAETGLINLTEYLTLWEIEIPANIQPTFVTSISADGYTIGGQGINTDTWMYVAWVVEIVPPVYIMDVVYRGSVEYNQVNSGLFADVNPGDPVTVAFQVSTDDFIDSETYNVRGYNIIPGSFTQTMGSVTVGLADPFPAGETARFIMRNNDPASDGFFIESTNIDWPLNGVPLNEPGQIAEWFTSKQQVGYTQAIDSLDIIDAVGVYDYDNLESFYTVVADEWADAIGLEFIDLTISVFHPFEVSIDCTTPTLTLPDMGGFDVSAVNNTDELIQVQGALNLTNCYDNTWVNIRRGTTNLQGGETFTQSWMMNIPRYNSTCNCDLVWTLVGTDLATGSEMEDSCTITTNCDF